MGNPAKRKAGEEMVNDILEATVARCGLGFHTCSSFPSIIRTPLGWPLDLIVKLMSAAIMKTAIRDPQITSDHHTEGPEHFLPVYNRGANNLRKHFLPGENLHKKPANNWMCL